MKRVAKRKHKTTAPAQLLTAEDMQKEEGFDELYGENDEPDIEDEEGEDLQNEELLARDYQDKPEQNYYESDGVDDEQYDQMDHTSRREAEKAIRKRERAQSHENEKYGLRRIPQGLLPLEDSDEDEEDLTRAPRRRKIFEQAATGILQEEEDDLLESDLTEQKGSLREWVVLDTPRRQIAKMFRTFLTGYTDEKGNLIYVERITAMCAGNKESLVVSYPHMSKHVPYLSLWLVDVPTEMLKIFDEVAMTIVLSMFPEYSRIHKEVHVRISDLPLHDSLRDLRQVHLGSLVRVSGVVTRRTGVFPQLTYVKYDCGKCGFIIGPFYQAMNSEIKVGRCPECESKGPFSVNTEQTIYRDYQKITLQESPGSVPAGRLPRTKDVILLADLIDAARPGEEVELTGIYRNNFDASLNTRHGFPVFATVIEGNYLSKKQDTYAAFRLTEEDKQTILGLAKDPRIGEKIIASIAPSIYGHEDIKTALALTLFGGTSKTIADQKHRIRGDINLLLLGDPGTAKSQFLKYAEKTAYRAVYTTGQGASAVGLTASVHKDHVTGEWTLEGGALVLADKGVCLIDEFDKMNDKDRTSIHEAMEQQTISISKAGIVTTLQARCSVIAAANPIGGRYRPSLSFAGNVELTEPILSRFDIMCVVRDTVDPIADASLASFVVSSHIRSHPSHPALDSSLPASSQLEKGLSQDILRKYITYARKECNPQLTNMDRHKIENLYADLRKASMTGGGIPMTVRHLESIIRMAEAHARMHLREFVNQDDVNMAIRVMLDSFIAAQKFSVSRTMRKMFRHYITFKRDHEELLFHLLQSLMREELYVAQASHHSVVSIPCERFEIQARDMDISNVESFYNSALFAKHGFVLDSEKRQIQLQES